MTAFPFSKKKNFYTLKNIERKGPSITLILESTPKYSKRILIFSTQYILVFSTYPIFFPILFTAIINILATSLHPKIVSFITQQPVGLFASGFLHSISFFKLFQEQLSPWLAPPN